MCTKSMNLVFSIMCESLKQGTLHLPKFGPYYGGNIMTSQHIDRHINMQLKTGSAEQYRTRLVFRGGFVSCISRVDGHLRN